MANADFSYWRKQTRLTIPEAVHLLCDVEPPAWTPESRYATARLVRAHQALIASGVIRSEAANDSVLPTTWVERAELVQAIASGKLPGFGKELLRAMRDTLRKLPDDAASPSRRGGRATALKARERYRVINTVADELRHHGVPDDKLVEAVRDAWRQRANLAAGDPKRLPKLVPSGQTIRRAFDDQR